MLRIEKVTTEDMRLHLTRLKLKIGWYPETMFKDGIKLTIKWFFEHEDG